MKKRTAIKVLVLIFVVAVVTVFIVTRQSPGFEVSSIALHPAEAKVGEEVIVCAEIRNTGGTAGTYTAILMLNGEEAGLKEIRLASGETKIVTFAIVENNEGVYQVEIDGLTETLKVAAPKIFRTIVIFRDDDPQPFFKLECLENVNKIFIEENVPVTLGIIPYLNNKSTLTEDRGLCNYLKGIKSAYPDLFEFALHGYTHKSISDFYGRSEFGGLSYSVQCQRIHKGKEILVNALNVDPVTFVAPYGTYDENTVLVLKELGFKVVSGESWFAERYYGETQLFTTVQGIIHAPGSGLFVENWVNHSFYSLSYLENRFENSYRENLIYIQEIHYFTFSSQEKLDQLKVFIEFIKNHERVKFMTLGDFGTACIENRIEKIAEGWRIN